MAGGVHTTLLAPHQRCAARTRTKPTHTTPTPKADAVEKVRAEKAEAAEKVRAAKAEAAEKVKAAKNAAAKEAKAIKAKAKEEAAKAKAAARAASEEKAKALKEAKEAALREKALKEAADLIAADAAGRSGEPPPVGPNAAPGGSLLPPPLPPTVLKVPVEPPSPPAPPADHEHDVTPIALNAPTSPRSQRVYEKIAKGVRKREDEKVDARKSIEQLNTEHGELSEVASELEASSHGGSNHTSFNDGGVGSGSPVSPLETPNQSQEDTRDSSIHRVDSSASHQTETSAATETSMATKIVPYAMKAPVVVRKCQEVLGLEKTGAGIIADMKEICELTGVEFVSVKDTSQELIFQVLGIPKPKPRWFGSSTPKEKKSAKPKASSDEV